MSTITTTRKSKAKKTKGWEIWFQGLRDVVHSILRGDSDSDQKREALLDHFLKEANDPIDGSDYQLDNIIGLMEDVNRVGYFRRRMKAIRKPGMYDGLTTLLIEVVTDEGVDPATVIERVRLLLKQRIRPAGQL